MALLALLRKHHGGRRNAFAASPEAMAHARLIGSWNKRRYREATRKLCDLGELARVPRGRQRQAHAVALPIPLKGMGREGRVSD